MTRSEFEALQPGDVVSWSAGHYTREYDVVAAPVKTKLGLMIRVRCRIYGEHEIYATDVQRWNKQEAGSKP